MQLHFTLDGSEGAIKGEFLARAILILCGSDAIVSRAIEGFSVTGVIESTLDHVALVQRGDTDDTVVHLPPLDDAAALLAHGGVVPPPAAATDSTPALPSGNVVAPPPVSSAPTAGEPVRLDSAGMPYDVRIHSGAMSTKKDGTWTAKRGVSELLITQIEAEHRAAGYGQPVSPGVTTTITPAPAAGTTVVTPPPVVAGPPAPGVVPPPAGAPDEAAFKALISQMGTAMSANQLAKPQIDAALAAIGLKATPELKTRPDLIETFKLHLGI